MGGKAINPTPSRNLRVEDDLWDRFGEAAGPRNRSAVIVQLIRWYLRMGPLPKRPPAAPVGE